MNSLCPKVVTGTTGELLVQLRLFQYGIQAAPPLKDSGNDLIAVRGKDFRAVQVKTTRKEDGNRNIPAEKDYHILALVWLAGEGVELHLDQSEVYLIGRESIESGEFNRQELSAYEISQSVVDGLFPSSKSSVRAVSAA